MSAQLLPLIVIGYYHSVQLAKFQLYVLMMIVWKAYNVTKQQLMVCGENANHGQ